MGLIGKLFGRRSEAEQEQAREQARADARAAWALASRGHDAEAMEQARSALADARLYDEYVRATEDMAKRAPDEASRLLNDVGVHYYFEQEYERALTYYTRSYLADEDAGSVAEGNILEVCRKIAEDANTPQDEVRILMRYFRICTRQIDPDATIENIDLLSLIRPDVRSLAEETREAAQGLLDELEDIVSELDDVSFIAATNRDLDAVAQQFGLERSQSDNKQTY